MQQPNLAFACELDAPRLAELSADSSVIDDLKALDARVLLMLSDYSTERAKVVRELNRASVPVMGPAHTPGRVLAAAGVGVWLIGQCGELRCLNQPIGERVRHPRPWLARVPRHAAVLRCPR
jgi:hypothetical protein